MFYIPPARVVVHDSDSRYPLPLPPFFESFRCIILFLFLLPIIFLGEEDSEGRWRNRKGFAIPRTEWNKGMQRLSGMQREIEIDALTREPLRIVIPSVLSVLSIDVIVDRRK